jgi:hypothetical protein
MAAFLLPPSSHSAAKTSSSVAVLTAIFSTISLTISLGIFSLCFSKGEFNLSRKGLPRNLKSIVAAVQQPMYKATLASYD